MRRSETHHRIVVRRWRVGSSANPSADIHSGFSKRFDTIFELSINPATVMVASFRPTGKTRMNPMLNQARAIQTPAAGSPASAVLASNKVIRNTYLLLAMTLAFSALTAAAAMAMNLPHPGQIGRAHV